MINNTKELLEKLDNITAEEAIIGIDYDPAVKPIKGKAPDYMNYDVDINMTMRFKEYLKFTDDIIDKINDRLNRDSIEYEGDTEVCPNCGKSLSLVGNDGHFCKFCGQHFKAPANKNLSETLKKMRVSNDVGQVELSKAIKISASGVCNYEKGKRIPTIDELQRIATFYNCSVNTLFGQDTPRAFDEKGTSHYFQPTFKAEKPQKEEEVNGYELEGNEYIFRCPHCKTEIDLTPMESLTLGLPSYEAMRIRSNGNDGHFCKCCGQGIERPVKVDKVKAFNAYKYWIEFAANKVVR